MKRVDTVIPMIGRQDGVLYSDVLVPAAGKPKGVMMKGVLMQDISVVDFVEG